MKKLLLLTFAVICIGIIIPCKVHAVDISIGATTWYSWWDFDSGSDYDADIDPTFLYGPALSVKFNDDFNLTFVYLYGKYDMKTTYEDSGVSVTEKGTVKRKDSDTALNYRLNDYFKVFAGLKYMSFLQDFNHRGFGPGVGLSATYPVAENLFLLATFSGFYLWGEEGSNGDYKEYGFNSTLSLAYYIASASTTVSLGGRFQYVKTDYDEDYAESGNKNSNTKSKIYGVTLTATYSFNI